MEKRSYNQNDFEGHREKSLGQPNSEEREIKSNVSDGKTKESGICYKNNGTTLQ